MQIDPITLSAHDAADGESWEEVRIVDTELPGIDARALGFMDVRFSAADLSGAKLPNLFLSDCELVRCNLSNAVVHAGSMRRSSVSGARLTGLAWTSGEIGDTKFSGCRADL